MAVVQALLERCVQGGAGGLWGARDSRCKIVLSQSFQRLFVVEDGYYLVKLVNIAQCRGSWCEVSFRAFPPPSPSLTRPGAESRPFAELAACFNALQDAGSDIGPLLILAGRCSVLL